jgi:WD40 repeat protein
MAAARLRVIGALLLVAGLVAATAGQLGQPGLPAARGAQPPQVALATPPPPGKGKADTPARPERWREHLTLEPVGETSAAAVVGVALSRDGAVVVTGNDSGAVRLWDALTAKERASRKRDDGVRAVRTSADGKTFLVARDKEVVWLDAATFKEVARVPWKLPKGARVALGPDGKTAAVAGGDGFIDLWQLSGKPEAVRFQAHDGPVFALALSEDGKALATGGGDGTVKVWDVATRKSLAALKPKVRALVRALAFTPDGKVLAAAHGRQGVHLWALGGGKQPPPLRLQSLTFVSLAASPDGRLLVAGAANGAVRVWDLAKGDVVQTFKPHAGQVTTLAFAADGKAFATTSTDMTVRVWRPVESVNEGPKEHPVSAAELDRLLKELRTGNGAQAIKAILALAGTPRQTLAVLKKSLRPVRPVSAERVAKLLGDLNSNRFAVREKAHRALEECADRAREELKKALDKGVTEEVRRRVVRLLERVDKEETPELRFQRRAVEVLERIGAREARDLLHVLADGVPDARLTRYAQDALKRLDE